MTKEPLVLAAIDLAHAARSAPILRQALVMAETRNARLAVVSVLPDLQMGLLGPWLREGATQEVIESAGAKLHEAVADALGAEAAAGVQHILRQGTAYQEILTLAEERQPQLIVMGAHRPELRDYLIGPNAARVVRHARCSVMVLRE
ncbi:universal stress protein [Pseudooceanicola sp. CBS1P-1]|uniref:Universal stress protein n=1 Tax=Pseudooceanicola albus TaxID=2692189 RepID=A0A6L7GD31_9RHOB|nr:MULTISPECIES: universal stress protein [Pseudooceanicola]MBT9386995.1 universal stress protein [Pseudooceanicola endophyticus]MXN21150.1 universal stress protein [Pseudooceanicola albus]